MDEENTDMLTIEDVLNATGGNIVSSNSHSFTGVSIDSRTIREDELFIPLKGDRFDGHDFLYDALQKCIGALIHHPLKKPAEGKTIIFVKDTLRALQQIARSVRLKRNIPVVAITGSNGKTTTKELIASILGTGYRILKNAGNLNNHIGLPLSLAKMSDEHEIAVLEMGASGPGEIEELCRIAVPDYGVLTNISRSHLEGFKNLDTIRKTKLELLYSVKCVAVNADDTFLMEGILQSGFKGEIVRYGINNPAEIRAGGIRLLESGSIFLLKIGEDESIEVNPKISGLFNIYNILAAASVGHLFAVDPVSIKHAIDSFEGVAMRLQTSEMKGVRVISDVYNANPASMQEAVKELARIKKGRAIAVLGDMLELGAYSEEAHRGIGRLLSELKIDIVIAVGPGMAFAASEFQGSVYKFETAVEAGKLLKEICRSGDTVLIKGSRGIKMEKVMEEYAI